MKTGINGLLYRVLLATALAIGAHVPLASAGGTQEDHLKGYKVKDLNKVPGGMHTLDNRYGTESCELKKVAFHLVRSAKDNGDDPRGGTAKDYVCYKAKCTGGLLATQDADSQLGLHTLEAKKPKLVCLPVGVCPTAGEDDACSAYSGGAPCSTCCDGDATCQADCTAAVGDFCGNSGTNSNCAAAVIAAGCADECCP
jgi:hypothetical protein